jgi:thiamine-phosphate pyrophosphorylase
MLDFNLYLITDREQTAGRQLPAVVADALKGGVKCVQLREKDLSSRQLFELAVELRQLTHAHNARLLINDRIDIALATEADGVHLGVSSMPVAAARRLLGTKRLIGYSAHSLAEARQAELDGADFITFSPIYHTPSKAAYGEPQGIGKLAETVRAISIPVFALGGVKKTSVPGIMTTGCAGVALISAIIGAADPASETHIILKSIAESSRAC